MLKYDLALDNYKGPLQKLLELIEEEKLEITSVSLAQVTAGFLDYLNHLTTPPHSALLADFLAVASKLVLIKSKVLLPSIELSEEEEGDIHDLTLRLKLYQQFKLAEKNIKGNWRNWPVFWSREFLASTEPFFYPSPNLTAPALLENLKRVLVELERFAAPREKIESKIIDLKRKIEEILSRLTRNPLSFASLGGHKNKDEVIVMFLAILQLVKDQLILAEQNSHFGEIAISKSGESGSA